MRIYCDSSALLKRALRERESSALARYLRVHVEQDDALLTSSLTWVEVNRAIRLKREDVAPLKWIEYEDTALSGVHELRLDTPTLSLARRIGSPHLRSLDAIHLAAAIQADADTMLTYDQRLADVAAEMGIEPVRPED